MAFVRDFAEKADVGLTAGSPHTASMPVHETNDLLIWFVSKDQNLGGNLSTPSGWTSLLHESGNAQIRSAVFYKIAASASETAPGTTSTDTNDFHSWMISVGDANTTTPIDASTSNSNAAASQFSSPSVTTTTADCLILYAVTADGNQPSVLTEPGINFGRTGFASAVLATGWAWTMQRATGATPTPAWWMSLSEETNRITVAVRNKTGGRIPAYVDDSISLGSVITTFGTAGTLGSVSYPAALSLASIGGKTTATYDAPAAAAGFGLDPNAAAVQDTPPAGTVVTTTLGFQIDLASDLDLSTQPIGFSVIAAGPGDAQSKLAPVAQVGALVTVADVSNNYRSFHYAASDSKPNLVGRAMFVVDADQSTTDYAESGTPPTLSAIRKILFTQSVPGGAGNYTAYWSELHKLGTLVVAGGDATNPVGATDFDDLGSSSRLPLVKRDVASLTAVVPIQFGGSDAINMRLENCALQFPRLYSPATKQIATHLLDGSLGVTYYGQAGDTIQHINSVVVSPSPYYWTIHASASASATWDFSGLTVSGATVTLRPVMTFSAMTFVDCPTIATNAALIDSCAVTDSKVVVSSPANAESVTNTDFTSTGTGHGLEIGGTTANATLTGLNFFGYAASDGSTGNEAVYVNIAAGSMTLFIDGGTTPSIRTAGATVTVSSPTFERGQEFTGLLAGSFVTVFETGTDVEVFATLSSGTTETWDDATAGTITVDYVIMKAGYNPIRVVGVPITGAVGTGIQSVPVAQVPARWYQASSGLTIGVNFFANAATKLWGLTAASTLQNLASYLMEQWIALGSEGEAFANKPFPIEANGPNSFTWTLGWEADLSTYADSITNLSRDGMRYVSAAGVVTASWAAILTGGVSAGMRVRFQQVEGTTQSAAVTSGNMDQLVQIYGDATHGNFDRTGYLVLKVQEQGFDQAVADVVAQYGTLEDQLYVVALAPVANGVATGDPGLSITITDHGASPVTWNGVDFSITVTDSASPGSGTDILRELRFNFEAGGAYQGKDGFNWHDLVQTNGTSFKTVRGVIYGGVGATLKGVRVVKNDGTTPHPDFNLFTGDDGSTYSPPVVANISISSLPDAGAVPTRLQIINASALAVSAWQATTAYSAGNMVLRTAGVGTENTAGLYFRCTTAGTTAGSEPTWNTTPGGTTADGTVVWTTYAVLFYDDDPAGTGYSNSYTDGQEFLAGESVEVRFAEMNGSASFKRYHQTTIASSSGFSFSVSPDVDDVFATNALDGSDYEATFSPNFTSSYIVLDTNTDFTGKSAYAYFCYTLTTSQGMYLFWDGVTALDTGNYRIETDVLDLFFDESAGFVKQTDDVRIFRKDGARPALDPTTGGNGIEINWRTPVSVTTVIVSGSNVITGDIADIPAAPSAAAIAAEVLSAAQSAPVHADVRKVTGVAVTGTGTEADPWGP